MITLFNITFRICLVFFADIYKGYDFFVQKIPNEIRAPYRIHVSPWLLLKNQLAGGSFWTPPKWRTYPRCFKQCAPLEAGPVVTRRFLNHPRTGMGWFKVLSHFSNGQITSNYKPSNLSANHFFFQEGRAGTSAHIFDGLVFAAGLGSFLGTWVLSGISRAELLTARVTVIKVWLNFHEFSRSLQCMKYKLRTSARCLVCCMLSR